MSDVTCVWACAGAGTGRSGNVGWGWQTRNRVAELVSLLIGGDGHRWCASSTSIAMSVHQQSAGYSWSLALQAICCQYCRNTVNALVEAETDGGVGSDVTCVWAAGAGAGTGTWVGDGRLKE